MAKPQKKKEVENKPVSLNRKAYHDYTILEKIEAGLVLTGTEIKSVRQGKVNIREAYARSEGGEMWLMGAHIAPYSSGNRYNAEPTRRRKLLLHRMQIFELTRKLKEKGLTLVPLSMYFKHGVAKIELGIGKGKKLYDKRDAISKHDADREMARSMKKAAFKR